MLQPRRICVFFLIYFVLGKAENIYRDPDDGRGSTESLNRVKRDSPEVTTILLIDNDGGFGKPGKPAGLLTSTARTFVNEDATTEYATQIIGTTLDEGKLYAQILQTTSRVYYGGQKYKPAKNSGDLFIKPAEPFVIFPTRLADVNMNLLKPVKQSVDEVLQKTASEALFGGENIQLSPAVTTDDEKELLENVIRARKNDVFNKRNVESIKPTKVTQNNLPTFTVKHDFAPSGFSVTPLEVDKEEKKDEKKLRLGKGLFGKPTQTKFDTVTYVGFADFVTTVGNTVIVFMPHTANTPTTEITVAATTTSAEPSVKSTIKTFMSHSPGMVTSTIPGHSLSMQTVIPTLVADRKSKGIGEDVRSSYLAKEQDLFVNPVSLTASETALETVIEPSETSSYSAISRSSEPTEPLATYATTVTRSFSNRGAEKPLGLLKSIGGTKAYNGTTTLFTSLLYGTYVGSEYTQILQTSSSSFYVAENDGKKATIFFNDIAPESSTDITTDDGELLLSDEDSASVTEGIAGENDAEKEEPELMEPLLPTNQPVSRLVPSTVYKTFTYLTTFFIPADESSTTTSIRSREVITSDITYVTKVIDDDWLRSTEQPIIEPTEVNLIENTEAIEPEFQLPLPRVLAPEFVEPITEETDQIAETSEEPSTTMNIVPITETTKSTEDTTVSLTTASQPPTTTEATTESETEKTTTTRATTKTTATTTSTTTTTSPAQEGDGVETEENITTSSLPPTITEPTTTEVSTSEKVPTTPSDLATEDEEIEVVFKTLYTTYTYLTTFFQETTTSVSSREVVVTNIITSTLQSETIQPSPTAFEPSMTTELSTQNHYNADDDHASAAGTLYTTYTYYTTLFDEGETSVISRTEVVTNIAPTPTVLALPSSILADEQLLKSKFEMLLKEQQKLRAEETPTISETTTKMQEVPTSLTAENDKAIAESTSIQPTATSKRGKYGTIARKLKRPIKLAPSENVEESISTTAITPKFEKSGRTVVRKRVRAKSKPFQKSTTIDENLGITTIHLGPAPSRDYERSETVVTDITKSTSGGRSQVKRIAPPEPIERKEKSDAIYEDQIISESNNEEILPSASPTLLLQTSFTTFTYFTTVYKGSTSSDIISRLETITNVVTETVTPDALQTPSLSPEDATLPITYFTTFTYWTTLFRDGNTVVTSREETISNVVTPTIEPTTTLIQPTSSMPPEILGTSSFKEPSSRNVFVPGFVPTPEPKIVTPSVKTESPITTKPIDDATEAIILKNGIEDKIEPTTYYTTYTYFTTSYVGDSTVVKSRLETLTNVVTTTTPVVTEVAENDIQTGRAIATGISNTIEGTSSNELQTGLLSTVVSSTVNDGKTTLFSTDVFGTYIDGLYAKVLESTTKVLTGDETTEGGHTTSTASAVAQQKTGVISVNQGSIVDADGISTTYFTTKAIGTSIDQLYAQVVESTSSVLVDNDKKSALAVLQTQSMDPFKTGLVRLIEGSIIKDETTTLYESRVIGTVIDGRYAQIIESTSSYKIEPTETVDSLVIPTATSAPPTASPSAIQGSIPDDEEEESEDDDDENEDDKDKGRVRSRLSFQQKKKTFTPVIRPFSSRARPTFLPKKKTVTAASAQTVTRSNFTPTITATLATKSDGIIVPSRNRFSGRRSSSSSAVEVKPTSTKRFNGRSRSSNNPSSIVPTASNRGRSTFKVTSTPSLNLSSARGRGSFRSSSTRPSLSSETLRSTISPGRPRLRPTLSGFPGRNLPSSSTPQPPAEPVPNSTTQDDDDDDSHEDGEEADETLDEETVTPSTTTTTTEDPNLSRRNGNPLLRFRKPIVPRASTTTARPDTTLAPRRGVLNNSRNKQRITVTTQTPSTTTSRPVRTRPVSSYGNRAQLPNRARPTNNLFPPRGLLKKPAQVEEKPALQTDDEAEEGEDEYDENNDSNVEETSPQKIETDNRKVQMRRFDAQRRSLRVRRQSEFGVRSRAGSSYNNRYRRPTTQATRVQERYDYYDDEPVSTEAPKPATRSGRTRSRQNTQATQATPSSRIRPSPASTTPRAPFTLREKDPTSPRNTNFRRGQTTAAPRRRTNNYRTTEAPTPTPRKPTRLRPQTTIQTNQRRGYTNQRRPTTTRGRGRYDDDVYTYQQPAFDGTITVTHKIPSEVTIPIVSGKVTEFRNVITAKPSIEVLGPHQYTVTTTNGGTLLFLNSEVTNTLPSGATEVTRFLVHETPTSSVTFTPTTIRGRKTSFSHLVPSTVYEVENLVSTLQPSLSSPLANILLSQLLLGNLNIPKNVAQAPNQEQTPTTEYKTKTTTYVTSVTNLLSTVLPLTFRGKEILTTILDSSVNVITATEYITETIVITPTVNPTNQFNSLLLPALLQAQILNPPQPSALPALNPLDLFQLTDEKSRNNALRESDENLEEEKEENVSKSRPKVKKVVADPSTEVVTLYVSGRRPGEFSTVLSTIIGGDSSVRKRETMLDDIERLLVEASEVKQVRVLASHLPSVEDNASSYESMSIEIAPGMSEIVVPVPSSEINVETESLESVLGNISFRPTESSAPSNPTVVAVAYTKSTKKHSQFSKVPKKGD